MGHKLDATVLAEFKMVAPDCFRPVGKCCTQGKEKRAKCEFQEMGVILVVCIGHLIAQDTHMHPSCLLLPPSQVIRDKVAHGLRRPKPPLKKPSGSIATLGLEEIKEQVNFSSRPPRLASCSCHKMGFRGIVGKE